MDFFGTIAGPFFIKLLVALLGLFLLACLMYKLQVLFRKHRRLLLAERIEGPADIKAVLKEALRQKARFKVRMNARKRSFSSSLVDIGSSSLIIDALFPEEGNILVSGSRFIEVDLMLREADNELLHIPYTFASKFISKERFQGYPAVRVEIPDLIRRIQRREYLRITPPIKEPIYIQFELDGKQISEKIDNISGGGIGFCTSLSKSVLWRGRHIEGITIALPGGRPVIHCNMNIKSLGQSDRPVLIDGKPYYFFCGAEFVGIEDTVRESIVHYVIEKERDELKRLSREFA